MSDNGAIYINDISTHVAAFDTPGLISSRTPHMHTITSHSAEGYALAWSASQQLLTGDTRSKIHLTTMNESGWSTSKSYDGHTESVEDLQWSPAQSGVFCSCSADGTIRIWDARVHRQQLCVRAHETDVNCITWNRYVDLSGVGSSEAKERKNCRRQEYETAQRRNDDSSREARE
jgi:ribosome assembly protein RRB1